MSVHWILWVSIISGDLTNRNKTAEKSHQTVAAGTQAIDSSPIKDEDQISNTTVCLPAENSHLTHVKRAERSKIFGSLPNHLDSEETYRENRELIQSKSKFSIKSIKIWISFIPPCSLPIRQQFTIRIKRIQNVLPIEMEWNVMAYRIHHRCHSKIRQANTAATIKTQDCLIIMVNWTHTERRRIELLIKLYNSFLQRLECIWSLS